MKDFYREIKTLKRECKRVMEEMKKEKMEWKWRGYFDGVYDGVYEGQVKEEKNKKVPHGIGRWRGIFNKQSLVIEGEWRDGEVKKAVNYYEDGEEIQWQTDDGYYCQKWIYLKKDGSHL